jgi:hypothetical protein
MFTIVVGCLISDSCGRGPRRPDTRHIHVSNIFKMAFIRTPTVHVSFLCSFHFGCFLILMYYSS